MDSRVIRFASLFDRRLTASDRFISIFYIFFLCAGAVTAESLSVTVARSRIDVA